MNTQLLCLFTYRAELDISLQFVIQSYVLINPNIFILENRLKEDDLFITFNVEKGSSPIDSQWKTILVHRKKQSNTIYTINALNEVIKSKTGGQLDNSYQLDWEDYRNSIITTSNYVYKNIPSKVFKSLNLSDFK